MLPAEMTRIDDRTYRFTEEMFGSRVYSYLLVGTERALLIDACYGLTDIAGSIRSVTSLPLTAVLTHGHFDHICGARNFPRPHIHKKDFDGYYRHTQRQTLVDYLVGARGEDAAQRTLNECREKLDVIYDFTPPEPLPLPEEGYFELGSRRIEIIETPGHTVGSISLLDTENGWLFSGDTCCHDGVLLYFPESTDVKTYHDSLRKLRALAADGTVRVNYPSHQNTPDELSRLALYEELTERLERGELTEEEWNAGAIMKDGLRVAFTPERVRRELAGSAL